MTDLKSKSSKMRYALLMLFLVFPVQASDFNREDFGSNFKKGVRETLIERQSETRIRCAYTDELVPLQATSVDHIVSLREAWEYGAYTWTTEQTKEFYNDTENLVLVLSGINSSKGARKDWLPPKNQDWYKLKRAKVCGKYGLDCPEYRGN